MGETEDKDPPQQTNGSVETAQTPAEDATETDKLLKDIKKVEIAENDVDKTKDEPKVNGEEIINIPDDKEGAADSTTTTEPTKKVNAEEKEVKPKKIPIGGIKIPGFFTRNKDKSKGDGAENELLEKGEAEEKLKNGDDVEAAADKKPSFFDNLSQRLRNTFAKKPVTELVPTEENQENKQNEEKTEDSTKPEVENGTTEQPKDDQQQKADSTEPQASSGEGGRKNILGAIKLPTLGSIIPKRLRRGNADDIEMGNGPNNRAGLASMETLDDSLKDTEKDTVDKSAAALATDEDKMENIKLNDDKDAEKAAEAEQDKVKQTLWERARAYRCSIDDIAIVGGLLIFLVLIILILAFAFAGKNIPITAPIRDGKYIETYTTCGPVEGILEDSSFVFRGIPYAAPPTEDDRWKHSQLPDSIGMCWNDTLKAHNATEKCMHLKPDNTIGGIEDCLTLDIITPHVRYDNPLPVIVLIGADSITGPSPGLLRPSARYARAKDVIFVRPNFRMGVLGFLALKELSESARPRTSGNYGLGDIITALKWISLNIVHFGGDAKSVTLVGYRSGATLVTALISSNKTRNLYTRAWVSSGAGVFDGVDLATAERQNAVFMSRMNCSTVECLRSKPAEELVENTPDEWRFESPALPRANENPHHIWMPLDGEILARHPLDYLKTANDLRIVIGTTNQVAHSETLKQLHSEWTPELVRSYIQESVIGNDKALLEDISVRYNATYRGLVQLISDIRVICPLYALRGTFPSTFYIVTQPGDRGDKFSDIEADVQAILGRYEPHTFEQRRYVSSIQNLFYYYVSHGNIQDGRNRILEIGQDPLPRDSWPNCDFLIDKDIVPRLAQYN